MKKLDTVDIIKILLVLIGICILVLIYMLFFWNDNKIYENEIDAGVYSNDLISIWIETSRDSGMYEMSSETDWPGSGYEFNEELSYCENGSELTWNQSDNSITVNTSLTDSCWIYFDIVPDVVIASNITSYNASTPATLTCSDDSNSYNEKYHSIEINNISNSYTSCTLTYDASSTKTYLNDYVTSLDLLLMKVK